MISVRAGKLQPCKGIAGRHRDEERHEHGKPGDGDARRERRHGVPGRAEDDLPIAQAVGDRQLERRVPALGDRPQRQIRERAEQREGEEGKGKGFRGGREDRARGHGAPNSSPRLRGEGFAPEGAKRARRARVRGLGDTLLRSPGPSPARLRRVGLSPLRGERGSAPRLALTPPPPVAPGGAGRSRRRPRSWRRR